MAEDLTDAQLRALMEDPGVPLGDVHLPIKPPGFGPEREHDPTADPADARSHGRRRVHFDAGGGMPNHWHPNSPLHLESDDDAGLGTP